MGILNVTPDSFSDGGFYIDARAAVEHGLRLLDDGAEILDIGGESTRPGSARVDAKTEIARVVPVIERIARLRPDALISIDTYKSAVARAALDAGAAILNDVAAGLRDAGMVQFAADSDCGVILMHMQGTPETMNQNPEYVDVVAEVCEFLAERVNACVEAGVAKVRIVTDPGIGFGKAPEHDIALLRGIPEIASIGCPVLFGASKKSFLGAVTKRTISERAAASVAVAMLAVMFGAAIVRVHDVRETVDALKVLAAVRGEYTGE
jgi:dihydropteroate synthase